jgi:ribose-phosphate pyrophosphokinase
VASVNDKLCRLLFFISTLKENGAKRVTAVIPYLAYARKDRQTKPRDPVTTRYLALLLEAAGADVAMTLRSAQCRGVSERLSLPDDPS